MSAERMAGTRGRWSSLVLVVGPFVGACDDEFRILQDDSGALPPMSWTSLLEVCDVDSQSAEAWPVYEDGTGAPVTAGCAEAVGGEVGLDWESFGEEPESYEWPTTPAQLVVSAVLTIVAPSDTTVESVLSVGAPPRLFNHLERNAAEDSLSASDDAGELYYGYLTTVIHGVEFDAAPSNSDVAASYNSGVVTVKNWTSDPYATDGGFPVHPFRGAALMFHEAAHSEEPSDHIACDGHSGAKLCDSDRDGANGAEEWWRFQWFASNGGSLDAAGCQRLMDLFYSGCGYINDDPSYVPCLAASWDGCPTD